MISSFHIDHDIPLFDAPIQIRLSAIALLLDFKLDESYTPSKIAIRAGTTHADLKEVCKRIEAASRMSNQFECDTSICESLCDDPPCAGASADSIQSAGVVQHLAVPAQSAVSVAEL